MELNVIFHYFMVSAVYVPRLKILEEQIIETTWVEFIKFFCTPQFHSMQASENPSLDGVTLSFHKYASKFIVQSVSVRSNVPFWCSCKGGTLMKWFIRCHMSA